MRLKRSLVVAVPLIVASFASALTPCRTQTLAPAPLLATGLVWDLEAARLLTVDVASGELLSYSDSGKLASRRASPGSGPFDFSQPMQILRAPKALHLIDFGGKVIELDRRLVPTVSHDLGTLPPNPKFGVMATNMSCWAPSGDGLVGLGAFRQGNQGWRRALLRVGWSGRGHFDVIKELSDDDPFWKFAVLSSHFIAPLGARAYVLSFEPYGLLEIDGVSTRLRRGLPEAFGKLPAMPPDQGRVNAQEREAILTSSTGAAHVYSDGTRLFVAMRDMRSAQRRWLLAQYDPEMERVTRVWLLPSNARDVSLAPSDKQWALLETEGRRDDGTPVYGKLILFPAQALTGAGGTVDAPMPVCAR